MKIICSILYCADISMKTLLLNYFGDNKTCYVITREQNPEMPYPFLHFLNVISIRASQMKAEPCKYTCIREEASSRGKRDMEDQVIFCKLCFKREYNKLLKTPKPSFADHSVTMSDQKKNARRSPLKFTF